MLDPTNAMYIVVGTSFLLAAAGLLFLNFGDRLNRVFSLYLVFEGGAMITLTIPAGEWWQNGLQGLFPYLNLASPLPLLYLAACYRDRFGKAGLRRIAFPVLLGLGLLIETLHTYDHALFFGFGARPLRPLHYVLVLLGPSIMALLLARDGLQASNAARRSQLLSASLAFAFYPLAFELHLFIPDLMVVRPLESSVALLGLAPMVYLLGWLALVAVRDPRGGPRRSARKYLAILSLSPLSVVALAIGAASRSAEEAAVLMRFIMTGWLVVLVALVAYAILRHQLFGIESGIKWTLRRSFVPSALVACFVVVGQLLENYAFNQGGAGSWALAAFVCAGLALGYRPMQRFADRFADAAMPDVEPGPHYAERRRIQLYESALAAAWEDGVLTREERLRLDRLRAKLALSAHRARSVEESFGRKPGRA